MGQSAPVVPAQWCCNNPMTVRTEPTPEDNEAADRGSQPLVPHLAPANELPTYRLLVIKGSESLSCHGSSNWQSPHIMIFTNYTLASRPLLSRRDALRKSSVTVPTVFIAQYSWSLWMQSCALRSILRSAVRMAFLKFKFDYTAILLTALQGLPATPLLEARCRCEVAAQSGTISQHPASGGDSVTTSRLR